MCTVFLVKTSYLFVTYSLNQKSLVIKKRLFIGLSFLLLIFSGQAQGTYSMQNLTKISSEELFVYYQKSLNLERKGEIVALTGGVVGLLGILAGALITDNNPPNESKNAVDIAAVTMIAGGSAATIIGFSMYMTGASRVNRINKIQNTELFQMELIPNAFYCEHIRKYQHGITLRISF